MNMRNTKIIRMDSPLRQVRLKNGPVMKGIIGQVGVWLNYFNLPLIRFLWRFRLLSLGGLFIFPAAFGVSNPK